MEISAQDALERLMVCEQLRQNYEAKLEIIPFDVRVLLDLGQVLMELSNFQDGDNELLMTRKALDQFEKALSVRPDSHEVLWHMGNTYLLQAFHATMESEMGNLIDQSKGCYEMALTLDPISERYMQSIEAITHMPEYIAQLQTETEAANLSKPPPSANSAGMTAARLGQDCKGTRISAEITPWYKSDIILDIAGWVALALAFVGFLKLCPMATTSPSAQSTPQKRTA